VCFGIVVTGTTDGPSDPTGGKIPMKKLFPIALVLLGVVFLGAGVYTVSRGFDARDQVRNELIAQNITTPDDASIPNVRVESVATAKSMADIIEFHARESTGGLTYSEMGRFAAKDGSPAGTSDPAEAVVDDKGNPVPNGLRNVAFQAATLRTSLYSSVMAFEVANLVIGLGTMIVVLGLAVGGVGVALAGLAIPALSRKVRVEPVAAH
jgi:hypothetical protein